MAGRRDSERGLEHDFNANIHCDSRGFEIPALLVIGHSCAPKGYEFGLTRRLLRMFF